MSIGPAGSWPPRARHATHPSPKPCALHTTHRCWSRAPDGRQSGLGNCTSVGGLSTVPWPSGAAHSHGPACPSMRSTSFRVPSSPRNMELDHARNGSRPGKRSRMKGKRRTFVRTFGRGNLCPEAVLVGINLQAIVRSRQQIDVACVSAGMVEVYRSARKLDHPVTRTPKFPSRPRHRYPEKISQKCRSLHQVVFTRLTKSRTTVRRCMVAVGLEPTTSRM